MHDSKDPTPGNTRCEDFLISDSLELMSIFKFFFDIRLKAL